jgi:hypothetical protein
VKGKRISREVKAIFPGVLCAEALMSLAGVMAAFSALLSTIHCGFNHRNFRVSACIQRSTSSNEIGYKKLLSRAVSAKEASTTARDDNYDL